MPERRAKVAIEYAGRQLNVGDVFHMEPQHVQLYLVLGRIEPEEGEPGYVRDETAGQPGVYETRDMTARVKRPYHRKSTQ